MKLDLSPFLPKLGLPWTTQVAVSWVQTSYKVYVIIQYPVSKDLGVGSATLAQSGQAYVSAKRNTLINII